MDASLVVFLSVGATVLFAILAMAKDAQGKRYGINRMALLWLAAVPYFLSSVIEFTVKYADGSTEKVKITYSTWFLLALPVAMIVDNISRPKKAALSVEKTLPCRGGPSERSGMTFEQK